MITLADKVAIVTGAGSGIGAAIADCFASAGACVYVTDVNEAAVRGVAARLCERQQVARPLMFDVGDEASSLEAVRIVEAASGRVDILVNNAGVGHVGDILATSAADFERLWRTNVLGVYHLSRAVLPGMIERCAGSIINIASIAGIMGMEARFAYTTSKHAVVGITRAMAMDHGATGVRINAICPGRVRTPFVDEMLRQYPNPEDYLRKLEAPHAMKRMAIPEEIASAALYLASDAASFVTGTAMVVDGGYTTGK